MRRLIRTGKGCRMIARQLKRGDIAAQSDHQVAALERSLSAGEASRRSSEERARIGVRSPAGQP